MFAGLCTAVDLEPTLAGKLLSPDSQRQIREGLHYGERSYQALWRYFPIFTQKIRQFSTYYSITILCSNGSLQNSVYVIQLES